MERAGPWAMTAAFLRQHRLALGLLTGWFTLVAVAVDAWRDVPVIDDWTYAWSVERVLHTGRFDVLDWSSAYTVAQAFWGAAWSLLLGFSFGSLRLSTLALALVGCAALYFLLLELGASKRAAILGALTLAVTPPFVFLSASFMTDVPFTTFTTLALLAYVRAAARDDARQVWLGGLWAFVAFLVRQVAIITPLAGAAVLLLWPRPARGGRWAALGLATTWMAMLAVWLALRQTFGTTSIMERWTWNLLAQPASYPAMNAPLFVTISVYTLPALIAAASPRAWRHGWWRPLLAAAAVLIALYLAVGTVPQPLAPGHTWAVDELGANRPLVAGTPPVHHRAAVDGLLQLVGGAAAVLAVLAWTTRDGPLAAAAAFARLAWRRLRDIWTGARNRRVDAEAQPSSRWAVTRAPLLAYLAACLLLFNAMWMYHDRYSVPLLPVLIALALGQQAATRMHRAAPAIALALFAAVSLAGTRDALRYNQAVRDAWQSVIDTGVPASDIDAGYAWTGWTLYAHPEALAPGQQARRDVPWVTSERRLPYVIANVPLPGYAVDQVHQWQLFPWSTPEQLYVLRRPAQDPLNGP